MNSRSTTRPLVEGAFLAALAALLALVGIYLPLLSGLVDLIWTIPLIVLVVRQDLRLGILSLLVSGLLILMFSDPLRAIFLLLQFGAVGLFYGVAFKRRLMPGLALLVGVAIAIVSMAAVMWIGFLMTGLSWTDIQQQIQANVNPTIEFYRRLGLLQVYANQGISEEMLRQMTVQMVNLLLRLLPGMLITGAAMAAVVNYFAAYAVLKRVRIPVAKVASFREWQLPWYLTWGVILGFAAWLGGDYLKATWLVTIGQNILVIYAPFLLVFGLSVVTYYYQTSRIPKLAKYGLLIVAVLYLRVTVMMLIFLGLFDPLFDYRKLRRQS
ncbi:MAG: YybS family protein [Firmicutes bacterium]|nr:YybS family protein [Bacillota bacterium]